MRIGCGVLVVDGLTRCSGCAVAGGVRVGYDGSVAGGRIDRHLLCVACGRAQDVQVHRCGSSHARCVCLFMCINGVVAEIPDYASHGVSTNMEAILRDVEIAKLEPDELELGSVIGTVTLRRRRQQRLTRCCRAGGPGQRGARHVPST